LAKAGLERVLVIMLTRDFYGGICEEKGEKLGFSLAMIPWMRIDRYFITLILLNLSES
jgi:hypothetical protein